MLEFRASCERCGGSLPADSADARICSYECTFCARCAQDALGGRCPDCGGELVPRPRRAAGSPANAAAAAAGARSAAHAAGNAPASEAPFDGGCDCGAVRYRMTTRPLFVHCCHCRWCQRESGASFALNAMIEAERVTLLQGTPEIVDTPSHSGKGQRIARCPRCRIAVWSNYAGAGPVVRFVRVGTLDDPDRLPPDIHIFTESKQPWVQIPAGAAAVPQYYDRESLWPAESLARRRAILPQIEAYQASLRAAAAGSS
jgi:hypothetical protein